MMYSVVVFYFYDNINYYDINIMINKLTNIKKK